MQKNNSLFLFRLASAIIIVCVLGLILYNGKRQSQGSINEILNNPVWTTGEVYKTEYRVKHGQYLYYYFSVDGEIKYGLVHKGSYEDIGEYLMGHSFPVVFKKDNPSKNALLVLPEDFDDYKTPFPDSLSWVRLRKQAAGRIRE